MSMHVYPAVRCFHRISDFITIFTISAEKFEKEFQKWVGKDKILYTYRARIGLFHLLSYLKKNGMKRVIVPSYTCKEVVYPIKRAGLEIVFVDNDLKTLGIDNKNLNVKKGDILLWVNYFGLKSVPSKKILKSEAIIIEDNASFFQKPSNYADFTLYSFGKGKELSSSEGGAIVVNNKKYEDFMNIKFNKPSLGKELYRFSEYLFWRLATLRLIYKISRKLRRIITNIEENFDFTKDIEGLDLSMSSISKKLTYKQLIRMKKYQEKSKYLWKYFAEKIKKLDKIKILYPVKEESNFFSINLLVKKRDKLKSFLEKKGIFASLPWPYNIGSKLSKKKFKNSEKIISRFLQVKIDPTYMDEEDIKYITEKIREFYQHD